MVTQNTQLQLAKPIVFFDGSCPLCQKEIRHYRKLDADNALIWVDITETPDALEEFGISFQSAMERLHCINSQKEPVTGAYAFVLIWEHLPYYRHMSSIISTLRITGALHWVYAKFAIWRFRRRCQDGVCITVNSEENKL